MNRAQRRRQERADKKKKTPVLIAGDGVVAAELGHKFEARPHAELPAKQPGRHRWVATAGYVLSEPLVRAASDPDTLKILDNENLMSLAIGCWDCEQPLGQISVDSVCPGDPADR